MNTEFWKTLFVVLILIGGLSLLFPYFSKNALGFFLFSEQELGPGSCESKDNCNNFCKVNKDECKSFCKDFSYICEKYQIDWINS